MVCVLAVPPLLVGFLFRGRKAQYPIIMSTDPMFTLFHLQCQNDLDVTHEGVPVSVVLVLERPLVWIHGDGRHLASTWNERCWMEYIYIYI